jgi:hypothetical protein
MTVIAWDGRSLAADTLCTFGDYRGPMPAKKIIRRGQFAYGITGFSGWFEAWIKWHESGADPANIPASGVAPGDSGNFLVFDGGKAFICSAKVPYLQEIGAPDAWGCGADFAIGAMHAGADAKEAVEITIACTPRCGGAVDVIELLPGPTLGVAKVGRALKTDAINGVSGTPEQRAGRFGASRNV